MHPFLNRYLKFASNPLPFQTLIVRKSKKGRPKPALCAPLLKLSDSSARSYSPLAPYFTRA